jgi:MFS family permease
LFGERNFSVGLVGNLVCRVGSNAVPFMLPLLLQLQLGFTPLNSGLMLVPAAAGGMLGRRFVTGLIKRFGYHSFLSVNTVVVGLAIVSFGLIEPGVPLWLQILLIAIFGASNSMQFAVMNSATLRGLDPVDAGSGNSLFSMAQMLATGLGVTIGAGLINLFGSGLGSTAHGFRWAFVTLGLVTAVSSLIFRRMRSPGSRP